MAADAPLLAAAGVTVAYADAPPALDGFSLELARGEIVGLTGGSGSGKSTAAYALLGLARPPGRIVAGSLWIGGRDLLTLPPAEQARHRGRDVSLIVQNPRAALHPMLPIGAQIARIWRTHAEGERGAAAGRAAAVELLRAVGINAPESRARSFVHELSGGMAQRAVIAAALAANSRVLVADEATSGLDVTVQAQFLDFIGRSTRELGGTLLLVTQEPGVLANYCDRVMEMRAGRIVEAWTGRAYRARPRRESEARPVEPCATPAGPPRVAVRRLSKTFRVGNSRRVLHAVQDVSFEIAPTEALGLVGESGSGKTTVGRCLLGLERGTTGQVEFEGVGPLGRALPARARAQLQLVRQDPYDSFDPRWTLGRSLREPLDLHTTLSVEEKHALIVQTLQRVGCGTQVAARPPRAVAGGTLQRVNVARAFLTDPRFIVLDEPTSLLAPDDRLALVEVLRDHQARAGTSYLFISHDLATVRALCHRVAVMYLGQIVELAPTEQLFTTPRHPYTRALVAAYLDPHPAVPRIEQAPSRALAGDVPSPLDLPRGCQLASRCPHAVDRCRVERQSIVALDPGHVVRCWRAAEGSLPSKDPE